MATAAQSIIDDFRAIYKDCPSARAWQLLNQVDIGVQRVFRQRQNTIYIAVAAGVASVALPARALWVRRVRWQPNATGGGWLECTTEDALETGGSPVDSGGAPSAVYQTHDMVGGRLGLIDVPTDTTILVTGATNASPIVLTTGTHGLADGDPVGVRAVEGNTAANGDWYAKVTGYSATTLALYQEYALTTAVAGSGAYTSGGLLGTSGSPFLELETVWHVHLEPGSDMPDSPFLEALYLSGLCFLWACRRHKADIALYKALYQDVLNDQDALTHRRVGHTSRKVSAFLPRPGGYQRRA